MDQTTHHHHHHLIKTLTQLSRYQFLKKTTQLLLSVSVFSLLLSKYSCRLSLLHSFNFYFSTVPLQLFTHNIDKNCIFLLCNGLLVFVAKFSGLIGSSSSSKNSFYNKVEIVKSYEEYESLESKVTLLDTEEITDRTENEKGDGESHQEYGLTVEHEANDRESENGFLMIDKDGKESEVFLQEDYENEVKELDAKFPVLDQEQQLIEEEEENGMLSTEELNKKFEDFIRRMKEGIRIEAQHQLVMVN